MVINLKRIKERYPSLPPSFYKVLCERIKYNKFTDDEFDRAVGYVIDTCKYPSPSIAEFIGVIKNSERDDPVPLPYTPEEIEIITLIQAEAEAMEAEKNRKWLAFLA